APYRAVYLVNLVPGRYGGFSIEDVQQRLYPDDVRDLSPLLVGRVSYATESVLESARADQLEYLEVTSLPPAAIDVEAAERISTLRTRLRHDHDRANKELGIAGLEALLEPVLRGRRGWRIEERDGDKNVQRLIEMVDALDGRHVRTTLDVDLQAACDRVLSQMVERGALVLLDPRDGAIRALATSPNPTRLQVRKEWEDLRNDERQPLHHRAFRPPGNPPPPGSVFKIVTAAAALEGGHATAGTTFRCDGTLRVGRTTLKCYQRQAHGDIDLVTALEKSCNIWFYKISREVGLEALLEMASRLGYGEAVGFGDPDVLGLPPGARSIGELPCPFQAGRGVTFTMRTAIGHGAVDDVTPLQVAAMMASVAHGAMRVRPYLVESIGGVPAPRPEPTALGLRPSTLSTLRRGMIAAVETGTARPVGGDDLRVFGVAAKTGTPQAVAKGGRMVDHAWMAGYLPHDAPRLAFALLIEENDVGGGGATRPVMAELFRQPEFEALFGAGIR
ncbi:MAG: penicillin-binding transpeptidase domain-containing protein, partial [Planctomycetota bacterium JB042]